MISAFKPRMLVMKTKQAKQQVLGGGYIGWQNQCERFSLNALLYSHGPNGMATYGQNGTETQVFLKHWN